MSKTKIFLIEEDNDARQLFREFLKSENYQISLAIDEEDALERAGNGFQKIALVLINLLGKSLEEILEAGRAICRAGKINAPLVVLARKYNADLEGTNLQLGENEYVTYLRDGEQLSELLSTLTARALPKKILSFLKPPLQDGVMHDVEPGFYFEFFKTVRFMSFDCFDRNIELFGDFPAAVAPGDFTQYFGFALG